MNNGWTVFNDSSTIATTNTITASSANIIYDGAYWNGTVPAVPSPAVDPGPEDPLHWLHERVGEICELGMLQ